MTTISPARLNTRDDGCASGGDRARRSTPRRCTATSRASDPPKQGAPARCRNNGPLIKTTFTLGWLIDEHLRQSAEDGPENGLRPFAILRSSTPALAAAVAYPARSECPDSSAVGRPASATTKALTRILEGLDAIEADHADDEFDLRDVVDGRGSQEAA